MRILMMMFIYLHKLLLFPPLALWNLTFLILEMILQQGERMNRETDLLPHLPWHLLYHQRHHHCVVLPDTTEPLVNGGQHQILDNLVLVQA
jgi:hypothetical protein